MLSLRILYNDLITIWTHFLDRFWSPTIWTFDYKIHIDKIKSTIQNLSHSAVDENVRVSVAYFFCHAYFAVVENVVLVVSPANSPVVSALNRALVDYHT
jgi:hypothetical protein